MTTVGRWVRVVVCLLCSGLAGCDRPAPPEIAEFRAPVKRVVAVVEVPQKVTQAAPPVEQPKAEPTSAPARRAAPTAPAPSAEPQPEPETPKPPSIIGSWRVVDVFHNGQAMPLNGMEMNYTFAEDGTVTMSMSGGQLPEAQSMSGTFTVDGDSITLSLNNDSKTGTLAFDGYDQATIEVDEGRVVLARN